MFSFVFIVFHVVQIRLKQLGLVHVPLIEAGEWAAQQFPKPIHQYLVSRLRGILSKETRLSQRLERLLYLSSRRDGDLHRFECVFGACHVRLIG